MHSQSEIPALDLSMSLLGTGMFDLQSDESGLDRTVPNCSMYLCFLTRSRLIRNLLAASEEEAAIESISSSILSMCVSRFHCI
jgi:hypothetical protein